MKRKFVDFKVLTASLCCAVVMGVISFVFLKMLGLSSVFREYFPYCIWFLPLSGMLTTFVYKKYGGESSKGNNLIIQSANEGVKVPKRLAVLTFFFTLLTHFSGGSAGREGAALQLGGSIASSFGRMFQLNEREGRIMTMCGMAAGFAALFGTPLTSVIFAMEVITVGVMHYSAIVPCIISALVAAGLSQAVGIAPTTFSIAHIPTAVGLENCFRAAVLGVLCAVLSVLFCIVMEHIGGAYRRIFKNPFVRVFCGGCIVIAATYLVGCRDYNGAGMNIIAQALQGDAKAEAFLLKILFTALTLGAGFKGGEIVPSFFIGATFGCVAGPLLGLSAPFAASLGMAAVFCGVTNCPLASIMLCIEVFGFHGMAYYALCCAVSYMLSGYYGLYTEQKIMYSKVEPEFINKNVH